jgi:hypothetical protein
MFRMRFISPEIWLLASGGMSAKEIVFTGTNRNAIPQA